VLTCTDCPVPVDRCLPGPAEHMKKVWPPRRAGLIMCRRWWTASPSQTSAGDT